MASRSSHGQFKLESQIINTSNFGSLSFTPDVNDLNNFACLTAKVDETSKTLNLHIRDCSEHHNIFCRTVLFTKPNCSKMSEFSKKDPFSILLKSDLKVQTQLAIAYQKAEIMEMIKRIDMTKAYQSFFQTLWYSNTPCFNVRNASKISFLKYCEWKGIPMSCSSIFTSFPTDQGVCCSFNMKAAVAIYKESKYQDILTTMQVSISSTFKHAFFVRILAPKTKHS